MRYSIGEVVRPALFAGTMRTFGSKECGRQCPRIGKRTIGEQRKRSQLCSRGCVGSSELADCDRRNSAYCNKRYGRPATRCSLVVDMVVESVGAHAIDARRVRVARQCDVVLQSGYCCRSGLVVEENDMCSVDESSSWRAVAECVWRRWDRDCESERESQTAHTSSIPPKHCSSLRHEHVAFHLLTALTTTIFPSPRMRSNHSKALRYFRSSARAVLARVSCRLQVLSVFYSFASRR
jgi:hypothetical protein